MQDAAIRKRALAWPGSDRRPGLLGVLRVLGHNLGVRDLLQEHPLDLQRHAARDRRRGVPWQRLQPVKNIAEVRPNLRLALVICTKLTPNHHRSITNLLAADHRLDVGIVEKTHDQFIEVRGVARLRPVEAERKDERV